MTLQGEDLKTFLEEIHLCHWATVGPDGKPWARPLWYLYQDRVFWFTTRTEVRRTGADAVGSPVAVSIGSEDRPYRAVVLQGTPEVWSEDRDAWLERIATRYGDAEGRKWLKEALSQHDRVVMRLVPERIIAWDYGKKGPHVEISPDDLP
jgi:PPOX class probable F420-dependent enzyme